RPHARGRHERRLPLRGIATWAERLRDRRGADARRAGYVLLGKRRCTAAATAARAAVATVRTFVVTQVRHALQHAVATGACSPYFALASASRPVQIVCTGEV